MDLSIDDAYNFLKQENTPLHIIRHSEKVALISLFLGCFLKKENIKIDLKLLTIGALLHDIKKYQSILTGENHAFLGYEFFKNLGYERIANIIKAHIYLEVDPNSPITEEEIVHYADKRVKHEKIVTLEERFKDLRERYGKNKEILLRLEYLEKLNKLIEKRIFEKLPFTPAKLLELERIEEVRDVLKKWLEDCSSCWRNFL